MRWLSLFAFVPLSAQYLTVNPSSATISAGQSIQLTATIGGVSGPSSVSNFSWRLSGQQVGAVTQTGLYTAPAVPISSTATVMVTANVLPPGATVPQLLGAFAVVTISTSVSVAGQQGPAGPPGLPGPPGPAGPQGPPGASAQSHWQYQEIPQGGYTPAIPSCPSPGTPNPPNPCGPAKTFGTGFILTLKCSPVSGTIHLWSNGTLYYENKAYYIGAKDPAGNVTGLGPNQIAAINFDAGFDRAPGDPNANCGSGPCPVFRVDYQYTPDGSSVCP